MEVWDIILEFIADVADALPWRRKRKCRHRAR